MSTDTLNHSSNHPVEHEEEHHDATGTKLFGFWVYLMSDLVIFEIGRASCRERV